MGRADSLEKAQAHNIVLASGGATAGFESVVLFTYFIPWARAQVEGPARTQAPTLVAMWPEKRETNGDKLLTKIPKWRTE